jgi:SAM-dependent methyltransferase
MMEKSNEFLDLVYDNQLSPFKKRKHRLKYRSLFRDVSFHNKSVLDIGGGYGMSSFFMAYLGAIKCINVEPEGLGSRSGLYKKFNLIKDLLGIDNVEFRAETFQDFKSNGEVYDIVLLDQSINHLDEEACIDLQTNPNSRKTYLEIFTKLYKLSNKNSQLIISDCSRYNFFQLLNIKNPIAPSIEWEKHQSPKVWIKLLKEVGFSNPSVTWRSNPKFGKFGEVFFKSRFVYYFFNSHFDLIMKKL